PRARASPILHAGLDGAAGLPRAVPSGLELLLADRAQHFVGLRRAHAALHAGAALGAPPAGSPAAGALRPAAPTAPGGRVAPAAAAVLVANGELKVPLGAEVVGPEQQGFAVCPLGVGETRLARRAVRHRLAQREQAEIEERAEPYVGVERRRGGREAPPRGLRIRVRERRRARVVPRRVVLAARGELGQISGAGSGEAVALPCPPGAP